MFGERHSTNHSLSYLCSTAVEVSWFGLFAVSWTADSFLFHFLSSVSLSVRLNKTHLNQKYDQEVEVSDSSELLKQVLGNEVPEGVLWDRVTAPVIHQDTEQQHSFTVLLATPDGHMRSEACPAQKHGDSSEAQSCVAPPPGCSSLTLEETMRLSG